MRQRGLIALLAAAGTVAALLAPAPAAAQAVMEAAKKEGKVVWYSSLGLSLAQKVCDTFNKKSLGVTCELNRDGSERIFQKVM
ncbi:MAG: iron ABC transporter substrate-binding protein, partial [Candidatus Methylomirabilales bacterium]